VASGARSSFSISYTPRFGGTHRSRATFLSGDPVDGLFTFFVDGFRNDSQLFGEWTFTDFSADDTSGNNHHGATDSVSRDDLDRHGYENAAFAFFAIDSQLTIVADGTDLDDYSGGQTVSFWLRKPDDTGAIIGRRGDNDDSWELRWGDSDTIEILYEGTLVESVSTSIEQFEWAHVALILEPTGARLLVNGTDEFSDSVSRTFATTNDIRVGSSYNGADDGAVMQFDDLRIYGRVLSASELAALAAE
jgi:hypothetical protein